MTDQIMFIAIIATLLILALLTLFLIHVERLAKVFDKSLQDTQTRWTTERQEWAEERRQLLDRIQAPSFTELKHAEVKTIKAQQGIKEPATVVLEPV